MQTELNKSAKVAVIVAMFNREITELLEAGAVAELNRQGLRKDQIFVVRVPGAFEIPLAAKKALISGADAVVALGCVIRGETSHYDYVCSSVERGCTQLQLEQLKPVAFGILTTENEAQALDRVGGAFGHKGIEAAQVAMEMLHTLRDIESNYFI